MMCGSTRAPGSGLRWRCQAYAGGALALLLGVCAGATGETFEITLEAERIRFAVDLAQGNLAGATFGGQAVVGLCLDEYWLEADDGSIAQKSSEADDRVEQITRGANSVTLECTNEPLGVELVKEYTVGPVAGGLRKTVTVRPFARRGLLHLFSRVRLGAEYAREAMLYTPRQSWGGRTLLYGVRPLAEIKEAVTSTSGWDNRFVVAFRPDRTCALAHWRAEVSGQWVPHSGAIATWGAESPYALTYLPDGWRFRVLHCFEGTSASAAVDYALLAGDWYEAWALYRTLPGFQEAYRSLDEMPLWPRQVKYGTFWHGPFYEDFARTASQMCDRLGDEAYLTIGVFGWSLDGDFETERPFLTEGLSHVYTPEYFARVVGAIQEHPRARVGLYIQGMLIDTMSQCYRHHPDWVIHGRDRQPLNSGFADNPVGMMFIGNPRTQAWVEHHLARIRAVLNKYGCGYIYLDGGGYAEDADWLARREISFVHCKALNARVLAAVREVGRERALLINSQNCPYADMSWLECGYFGSNVPWRDTIDFCFDTECLQDPRYTLEPLYWTDNDRYLACCVAFGFTPCGDVSPDKPPETWRAIEAAWQMKPGQLVLNSAATAPVWWRDGVPVVTFAERVGNDLVVPVLNFDAEEHVRLTVDLGAAGYAIQGPVRATAYQPLVSAEVQALSPAGTQGSRLTYDLHVPTGWRGVTLVTIKPAG